MSKINIELDDKYREALDLLKQVIPSTNGNLITEDSKMVETLIDSFMTFIQEQASEYKNKDEGGDSCGNGDCLHH